MAVAGWVLFVLLGIIALMVIIAVANIMGHTEGMKDAEMVYKGSFSRGWEAAAECHRGKNIGWFDTGWKGMGKTVIDLMETAEWIQLDGNDEGMAYTPTARDWQAIKNGLRKAIGKEEGK